MRPFVPLLLAASFVALSAANGASEPKAPNARVLRPEDFRPPPSTKASPFGRPFYPLGFSPKGAFAWFEEPVDEACGCWNWRMVIQDLKTDRTLWEDSGSSDRSPEVKDLSLWLQLRGAAASEALQEHEVIIAPPTLSPFPYIHESFPGVWWRYWFTVGVDWVAPSLPEDDPVARISLRRVGFEKEIGRVMIVGGFHYSSPPQPIGLFISPFEPRAVIVLAMARRGYEGPPHLVITKQLGAHLEEGFGGSLQQ